MAYAALMQTGSEIAERTDQLSALGIADFRDPALDNTAGFSIEDDLKIARLLAYAYTRARTYNELVGIYEELRVRNIANEKLGPVAVDEILAGGRHAPVPLRDDDIIHGHAILEKVEQYVADAGGVMPRKGVVLENGSSHGKYLHGFSAAFERVVAVDFSMCFLVLCKKLVDEARLDNVTLMCANAERLPLESGSVDFIHSNNVVEHVSDKAAMFRETRRILADDGLLFVMSPNHFSAYIEPHFRLPFYGFVPEAIRRAYVSRKVEPLSGFGVDDIALLSLRQLHKLLKAEFSTVRISFIPSRLRSTVTGGRIRGALVKALNSPLGKVADFLINRLLLGIMPYHAALCSKQPFATARTLGPRQA
jgi:ubiquinone/menaquinone biosynthesis C-methylase UbiE